MTAVDLDAERAVEQAAEQTGLSDLGDDSWQEGLDRLVDSLRTEAALNELGAALVGGELVGYLGDRLRHRRLPQGASGDRRASTSCRRS